MAYQGLVKSINKKSRLYKSFLDHRTAECEAPQKSYKNRLNHLIRYAKKKYFDDKLEKAKGLQNSTWKILNEAINKQPQCTFEFDNGEKVADPSKIAERFCDYFTNIGPRPYH